MKLNNICLALIILMTSCVGREKKTETVAVKKEEKHTETQEERGKYLVNAMGCDDCHSPKKMGEHGPEIIEELRFSGYPSQRPIAKVDKKNLSNNWVLMSGDLTSAVGPWGMSFAANLTNDPTGIANWTEENFLVAIKQGKLKGMEGSRGLLPPMPWFGIKNLSDEDLKAMFVFFKTTKPVNNVVPAPISPDKL